MYIFSFVHTDFRCRCTLYPTYVNDENKTGIFYLSNGTYLIILYTNRITWKHNLEFAKMTVPQIRVLYIKRSI